MLTEFRRVEIPSEIRSLCAFDRKVFPADHFSVADWRNYDVWWLLRGRRKIGCCAFEAQPEGSLYISSTGILPEFQRQGYGQLMKAWQLVYARGNHFQRIEIHTRRSNRAMIALNRKFGFRIVRTERAYYSEPAESAVVMELVL